MNYEYMALRGGYSADDIKDPYERGFAAGIKEASRSAAGFAYEFDDSEMMAMHERVEASMKKAAVLECAKMLRAGHFESVIAILDSQGAEEAPEGGAPSGMDEEQAEKCAFVANELELMLKAATDNDVANLAYEVRGAEEFVRVIFTSGYVKDVCVTGDSLTALVGDVLGAL